MIAKEIGVKRRAAETTSRLPRLAAICSRSAEAVRFTNAAVSFGHTQVGPVDAPFVVTAFRCVASRDRIAGQDTVLLDAPDGFATRAIKLPHRVHPIERARRPSLARATPPAGTSRSVLSPTRCQA